MGSNNRVSTPPPPFRSARGGRLAWPGRPFCSPFGPFGRSLLQPQSGKGSTFQKVLNPSPPPAPDVRPCPPQPPLRPRPKPPGRPSTPAWAPSPTRAASPSRVWAPNADAVAVMGSLNDWSRDAHPLASEGNGYWSADVAEARPGDELQVRPHERRQGARPRRPLRPADDELGRERRRLRRVRLRLGGGRLRDGGVEPPRHLRAPHRHLQRHGRGAGHVRERHRAAGRRPRSGRQRPLGHARGRVRRRLLVGLQRRLPLRRRERLRRAGRAKAVHQRSPRPRPRRPPRRRLQPPGAERPRLVAVRRVERERPRRHLLLQRRPRQDPLGRHPPRLQPRGGPPLLPRQRHDVAGGTSTPTASAGTAPSSSATSTSPAAPKATSPRAGR